MTLRTLVVDDEPLARELLCNYVRRTSFLEDAGSCSNGIEALERIKKGDIDLMLLDIQMPELTGLELSKMVDTERVKIIFTTAFGQYAIEGYKVDAVDYLLKPISYAEFLKAVDRAQQRFEHAAQPAEPEMQSLFVKSDYKMVQVPLDSILYIEGVKDYIRIHTAEGEKIMTLMSMKTMEERLPASSFLRVHRSFIVAMDKIKVIERGRIVFGKEYIPISDNYKETFYDALSKKSIIIS